MRLLQRPHFGVRLSECDAEAHRAVVTAERPLHLTALLCINRHMKSHRHRNGVAVDRARTDVQTEHLVHLVGEEGILKRHDVSGNLRRETLRHEQIDMGKEVRQLRHGLLDKRLVARNEFVQSSQNRLALRLLTLLIRFNRVAQLPSENTQVPTFWICSFVWDTISE